MLRAPGNSTPSLVSSPTIPPTASTSDNNNNNLQSGNNTITPIGDEEKTSRVDDDDATSAPPPSSLGPNSSPNPMESVTSLPLPPMAIDPQVLVPPPVEGSREMSSEFIIGSLKVRVGVRKRATSSTWPRWAVQLLDVDGSELIIDTIDLSLPYINNPIHDGNSKTVTLTRDSERAPLAGCYDAPGGACTCASCTGGPDDPNASIKEMEDMSGESKRRRRMESDDEDVMLGGMRGRSAMYRPGIPMMPTMGGMSPQSKTDFDFDCDSEYGRPGGGLRYAGANAAMGRGGMMYGREGSVMSSASHHHGHHHMGGVNGNPNNSNQQQKSYVRTYSKEEKEELRAVPWPKKIKSNGLPALWCHSCYLDKKLFKIVSPLSPKPSIVYFRHQQCNTSYHKGENLPSSIVRQYQEYYRNRTNRNSGNNGGAAMVMSSPSTSGFPSASRVGGMNSNGSANSFGQHPPHHHHHHHHPVRASVAGGTNRHTIVHPGVGGHKDSVEDEELPTPSIRTRSSTRESELVPEDEDEVVEDDVDEEEPEDDADDDDDDDDVFTTSRRRNISKSTRSSAGGNAGAASSAEYATEEVYTSAG